MIRERECFHREISARQRLPQYLLPGLPFALLRLTSWLITGPGFGMEAGFKKKDLRAKVFIDFFLLFV